MDGKIEAIGIGTKVEAKQEEDEESEGGSPMPKTADEWLAKMGFVSWPLKLDEENSLNLTPEDVGTGTLEDIINALAAHAPLDLSILDEVLKQIEELEKKVYFYASKILDVEVSIIQISLLIWSLSFTKFMYFTLWPLIKYLLLFFLFLIPPPTLLQCVMVQGAFHVNSTPKIRQYLLYLPLCFAKSKLKIFGIECMECSLGDGLSYTPYKKYMTLRHIPPPPW